MKRFISDNIKLFVFQKGEELHDQLKRLAVEQKLTSAWMSGVGGASRVELGFYLIEKKEYRWQVFDEPLEIVSLQGNLAIVDGEPFWHVHGIFGRQDFSTVSGHVRLCEISLTGEVVVLPIDVNITRRYDDETGLKLLAE